MTFEVVLSIPVLVVLEEFWVYNGHGSSDATGMTTKTEVVMGYGA